MKERPPRIIHVPQRGMATPIDTGKYSQTAAAIEAVIELHDRRQRTVDGISLAWCRECQQDYPCETIRSVVECFT